jgi:hypothetical protein
VRVVEVEAEVRQVKSMVDHSVNITLNIPEYCREQAGILLLWQGELVRVVVDVGSRDRH